MKRPAGFPPKTQMTYRTRPAQQRPAAAEKGETFKEFAASELYCPKCGTSMPVREKQLLYLPTGGVSDYRCAKCGTVLGTRRG